jgi:hypothetical protein
VHVHVRSAAGVHEYVCEYVHVDRAPLSTSATLKLFA